MPPTSKPIVGYSASGSPIYGGAGTLYPNAQPVASQTQPTTPTGLGSIAQPAPTAPIKPPTSPATPNPAGTQVPTQAGTGLADSSFIGLLNNLNQGFQSNNDFVKQKTAVVNAMLGGKVDDATLATLPKDIQDIIKTGDRNQLMLQAQVLNDQISGYGKGISSSIQFLTSGYQTAQVEADKKKQEEESNILDFIQTYGSNAVPFLKTKYPDASGTIDQLAGLQTLAEKKAANAGSSSSNLLTTGTGSGIVAGVKVDPAISNDVEDVLSGRNTLYNIRQTMGRTNAAAQYMAKMRAAIKAVDPTFDFVASDAGGKFVSSTFYQKALSAITSVEPNIDKAIELSDQVQRVGVAGVDKLLQAGAIQIGNTKVANFHEAQKLIADEIGLALGQGSVSDMKLQLGFDITDPSMSAEVFASNLKLVKEFIDNRKKALQDQRYSSPTVDGTSGGTQISKGSLSSSQYVEKVLSSQGLKYDDVVKQIPSGEIGVIDNTTGQIGSIPESEFNSTKYTRI